MKHIRFLLILPFFIFSLVCPAQESVIREKEKANPLKRESAARLVEAMSYYNSGRYGEAYRKFLDVTDMDPSNDAAYYYTGLSAYSGGELAAAEAALKEAVRLDPDNFWYSDMLARLYSATSREELTVSIYERLRREYPKKLDICYNLANLYAKTGQVDKVLGIFDDIDTAAGKSEQIALARYDVLMKIQKAPEAFAALESYADEFASARVLTAMGDHKMQMYDDTLALRFYDEALSYEYDYPPALLGSSEIYRQRRQYDRYFSALDTFMRSEMVDAAMKSRYFSTVLQHSDAQFAKSFQPQLDSLVHTGLAVHQKDSSMLAVAGSYFFATGREDAALNLFRRNVSLNPHALTVRADLVQSLSYLQRWDELGQASEEAFAAFPAEPGFLNMKALARYRKEDYEGVIDVNERLLAAFPADSAVVLSAYSDIGDMQHHLGNEKAAYKAYDKALKLNPDYAPVLNNYAYYISRNGKHLNKAYKMSIKTVKAEPDNATYLDTFGWILHMQKKDAEAKSFFKHAMLYGGKESATILDHYAEVLFSLGEYDLAQVYWNLAKAKNADGSISDLDERVAERISSIKK